MSNPWDSGPPDNRRSRAIGWGLVLLATLLLYLYLDYGDKHPAPAPSPSRTAGR